MDAESDLAADDDVDDVEEERALPEFAHEEVAALIEDAELEQQDEELSFALIARRNLPEDFLAETDADGIASAVAGLTHVHLDRCRLARLGGGGGGETRPIQLTPRHVLFT